MAKAQVYGEKVYDALKKLPEEVIPLIIGYILRRYKRYGLAYLVESAWDWKPEAVEGEST